MPSSDDDLYADEMGRQPSRHHSDRSRSRARNTVFRESSIGQSLANLNRSDSLAGTGSHYAGLGRSIAPSVSPSVITSRNTPVFSGDNAIESLERRLAQKELQITSLTDSYRDLVEQVIDIYNSIGDVQETLDKVHKRISQGTLGGRDTIPWYSMWETLALPPSLDVSDSVRNNLHFYKKANYSGTGGIPYMAAVTALTAQYFFLKDEYGNLVPAEYVKKICNWCGTFYNQLVYDLKGPLPKSWESHAPLGIRNEFVKLAEERFPQLALCEDHWKAKQLVIATYPGWHSKHPELRGMRDQELAAVNATQAADTTQQGPSTASTSKERKAGADKSRAETRPLRLEDPFTDLFTEPGTNNSGNPTSTGNTSTGGSISTGGNTSSGDNSLSGDRNTSGGPNSTNTANGYTSSNEGDDNGNGDTFQTVAVQSFRAGSGSANTRSTSGASVPAARTSDLGRPSTDGNISTGIDSGQRARSGSSPGSGDTQRVDRQDYTFAGSSASATTPAAGKKAEPASGNPV
ncbi:hypothetical protein NM688_g937 [Phlebia brevispora]|uniref:Uncharacterized protein n=1 Tax=Phlebia brevispora TaxID=194682 RepID=A0ACC1TCK4_9APHY|nr:hypothetical protein NM688_g937 [Phlebia brevispora]